MPNTALQTKATLTQPHIRVAVETSVLIGGLERFQHVLKTTLTVYLHHKKVTILTRRFTFSVLCQDLMMYDQLLCVSSCVFCAPAHVYTSKCPFVFSPLRLKA